MYHYSEKSKQQLEKCDKKLQLVFNEVIRHRDCTIISGYRTEAEQNELHRKGLSQLRFPDSKHNSFPSYAVDVAPYFAGVGIPWDDHYAFCYFAGFVLGIAKAKGIGLRWGGDFDQNHRPREKGQFFDAVHFELI